MQKSIDGTVALGNSGKLLGLGASHAAYAWIVYALVECWFLAFVPWLLRPSQEYVPLHAAFTAFLFFVYAFIGVILGLLAGSVVVGLSRRGRPPKQEAVSTFFSLYAVITVVLAYLVNFGNNYWGQIGRSELPGLAVALLLLLVLVLSGVSTAWYGRLRVITNPWTASFLLLGVPWMGGAALGPSAVLSKAIGMLLFSLVVVLSSLVFARLRGALFGGKIPPAISGVSWRYAATLMGVVVLTIGLSMVPRQAAFVENGVTADVTPVGDPPNVILIVMDTVRADHLSLHGYERDTTPNLRELASAATLYRNAVAPSDMTLPTHASLFTGLYPSRHHAHLDPPAYGLGRPLGDELPTLAEHLAGVGYDTLGVISNHGYVTKKFGMAQGFRYFDQRSPVLLLGFRGLFYLREGIRTVAAKIIPGEAFGWYRNAEVINEEVFGVLDEVDDQRRPFFLFINYMDAHWVYAPPPPYDEMYPGLDASFSGPSYVEMRREVMTLEREITTSERAHLTSQYDGEIAYLDHHIGELIAELKRRDLYDNSLLIITSDHGEALGDRHLVGHMVSAYQDQVSVHLVVKYPHQTDSTVVPEFVSLVDVMPTVLDVVGIDSPEDIDGQSLAQMDPLAPRFVLSESFPGSELLGLHPRFDRIERAVVFGSRKLVTSTAGKLEMYDLSVDPSEKTDLYDPHDPVAGEMEESLRQWLLQVVAPDRAPVVLDEATLERLRSLGYIQ